MTKFQFQCYSTTPNYLTFKAKQVLHIKTQKI